MLELHQADYNAASVAASQGMVATMGKGQVIPKRWKDASCVHPNLKGVMMVGIGQYNLHSDLID